MSDRNRSCNFGLNIAHVLIPCARRPCSIVSTANGDKILTQSEFSTFEQDGKIEIKYGIRQKQGGGDIPDYNDITYILKE